MRKKKKHKKLNAEFKSDLVTEKKLQLMFFSQEKGIKYLSPADYINLSRVSQYTRKLNVYKNAQICFKRILEFLSHKDIMGKAISTDRGEETRYPSARDLEGIKNSQEHVTVKFNNLMTLAIDPLYAHLHYYPNAVFQSDAFMLLLIPEVFYMPDIPSSIKEQLKKAHQQMSHYLLQWMLKLPEDQHRFGVDAIHKYVTELGKKYAALWNTELSGIHHINAFLSVDRELYIYIQKGSPNQHLSVHVDYFSPETLQFLYDQNMLRITSSSMMMKAAAEGHLQLFDFALRSGFRCDWKYCSNFYETHNSENSHRSERTPLMVAARLNQVNIVTRLLSDAESIKKQISLDDDACWTALMHACYKGNVAVVELIIEEVAKKCGEELLCSVVNDQVGGFKDNEIITALLLAIKGGHLQVVEKLMPYVSETIQVINHNGRDLYKDFNQINRALELAKEFRHHNIVRALEDSVSDKPRYSWCLVM